MKKIRLIKKLKGGGIAMNPGLEWPADVTQRLDGVAISNEGLVEDGFAEWVEDEEERKPIRISHKEWCELNDIPYREEENKVTMTDEEIDEQINRPDKPQFTANQMREAIEEVDSFIDEIRAVLFEFFQELPEDERDLPWNASMTDETVYKLFEDFKEKLFKKYGVDEADKDKN